MLTAAPIAPPAHFAPEFTAQDLANIGAAVAAASGDKRLTSTDAALYGYIAGLAEIPPADELAALIGKSKRTVWRGIKRLAEYGYIEDTGQAGYRNRVRQWAARIVAFAAAIPSAAAAAVKGIQYGKAAATAAQLNTIKALIWEILDQSSLNFSDLREKTAGICNLESGPETVAAADKLMNRLIQLKRQETGRAGRRRNRKDGRRPGNGRREPGRYYPTDSDQETAGPINLPDWITR